VLAALIACGLEPHWLAPERLDDGHRVTPAALGAALTAAPGARAAIVAAGEPDVAALVEVAHAHGAALVLDAAGDAPAAVAAGADLVIARHAGDAPTASLLLGPDAERWLSAAAIERAVALVSGRLSAAPPSRREPRALAAAPPARRTRRFAPALPPVRPGPTVCTPRAAWLAPMERVAPAAAVGRIAAEALTPDPPGVPAVLPGERLVPDVVATLRAIVDAGGTVRGSADGLATLAVVADRRR
jgi:hypothetical protein